MYAVTVYIHNVGICRTGGTGAVPLSCSVRIRNLVVFVFGDGDDIVLEMAISCTIYMLHQSNIYIYICCVM